MKRAAGLSPSSDAALGQRAFEVAATATANFLLSANPTIWRAGRGGQRRAGKHGRLHAHEFDRQQRVPLDLLRDDFRAQGPSTLVKSGPATLTLSGTNSYTGGTTVQQGTLVAANQNALGTGGVLLSGGALSLAPVNQVSGFSSLQLNGSATSATVANGVYP